MTSKFVGVLKNYSAPGLHLLIAGLLWAVAIWDISQIVDDYLHDNRYTLVRTVEIENGTAPFLEDAEICIQYGASIFQQVELDNEHQEMAFAFQDIDSSHKLHDWNTSVEILRNASRRSKLSLPELMHATKMVGSVYEMDDKFRIYAFCHDLSPVDDFLNSSRIDTYDQMIRAFIREHTPNNTELGRFVRPRWYTLDKICYDVKVRNLSTAVKDNRLFEFPIGVRNSDERLASTINNQFQITSVEINFPNKKHSTQSIPGANGMKIQVAIGNVGVYDVSQVEDRCQGRREGIPQLTNNCKDRTYFEAVEEFCHCVPYSIRNWNFTSTSSKSKSNRTSIGYCTQKIYDSSCMERVKKAIANRTCGQSCVTTKNSYDISSQLVEAGGSAYSPSSPDRVTISFVITDSAYCIYEEKFRLNFSQLIAQVGGDIGIYTGFSLLAFWQFLVFFYSSYREHQSEKRKKQTSASMNSNIRASMKALVAFLGVGNEKEGQRQQPAEELEFQKRLEAMEVELRRLRARTLSLEST